jgi:hypothetical protein
MGKAFKLLNTVVRINALWVEGVGYNISIVKKLSIQSNKLKLNLFLLLLSL